MNGNPSSSHAQSPPTQGGALDQIGALVSQEVGARFAGLESTYRAKLEKKVSDLAEDLEKEAKRRLRTVVLAAVGAVVAALALLAYAETRSMSQTSSAFYNSVMGLQSNVLATSENLGEKVSLIAAANKELETVTAEVESARAELQTLREVTLEAKQELESARQELDTTVAEYSGRLQELRLATASRGGA